MKKRELKKSLNGRGRKEKNPLFKRAKKVIRMC
jgi:hypothetical protein